MISDLEISEFPKVNIETVNPNQMTCRISTRNRASDKKSAEKATLLSTLDPRHWCINLVSRHGNSSSASMSHLSQNNHHCRPAVTARACSPPALFHRSAQSLLPKPPTPLRRLRTHHTPARATHTTPWFVKQGSDVVYATFIFVSRVFSEREIPGSWSTWLRGGVERRRIRCNDHLRAARKWDVFSAVSAYNSCRTLGGLL